MSEYSPGSAAKSAPDNDGEYDEYSNSPVPEVAKTIGPLSIFGVLFGMSTALIWFSLGAQLVHAYGTVNFFIGATSSALIIGLATFLWARFASQTGFNSDLVTRASGFGYFGSTVTALVLATNCVLYFGFEGGIMINAMKALFPDVPVLPLQIAFGLMFIPLTWFGARFISLTMWITLPVVAVFLVLVAVHAANTPGNIDFWAYAPETTQFAAAGPAIAQVMVAMFGVAGIGAQSADFGRFIPSRRATLGGVLVGPVFCVISYVAPLLFGAWLAIQLGENDPAVYFVGLFGVWGMLFVVITQARINVSNIYTAAVQLASVASRLGLRLARSWWVVITSLVCVAVLVSDLYSNVTLILGVWGVIVLSWVFTVASDLLINRKLLGLTPEKAYHSKRDLYPANPVGLIALGTAVAVGLPLSFGAGGPLGSTLAPFCSIALAIITPPVVAVLTKGRYYHRPTQSPIEPVTEKSSV